MESQYLESQPGQINGNDEQSMFHDGTKIEERHEIVVFEEDGDVAKGGDSSSTAFRDYLSNAADSLANDVKGFLSRPIELASFAWLPTMAMMTSVFSISLPNDWLARPMIKEKFQGFRYLRCDFVIRVQVNAQPFNAGRLLVYFSPFSNQHEYKPTQLAHLGGITGYRRVELDLSQSTAVEIRVPYMCQLSHFDLTKGFGSLGTVEGIVYSPLNSGTAQDVDGTIFVHAENIDIQLPTGRQLFNYQPTPRRGPAQSGRNLGEKEEKQTPGPVSSILSAAGSVARRLKDIPIVSDYAAPVAWIADAAAGVAGMFGFSKPLDQTTAQVVDIKYARNMANFDGDSKAKPLGLDSRNAVEIPYDLFQTQEDEMSLRYMTSKFTYLTHFFMNDTHGQNTVIKSIPVDVSTCYKAEGALHVLKYNTMLSYIANMFKWWRGGLKYHFKIVKTPFHSGRIRIAFVPGATSLDDLSTFDIDKCYSRIYDLRDTNEIEFSIPFVYNRAWKETGTVLEANLSKAESVEPVYEQPTGYLYIEVLNSLRNPPTCANSIDFIVEVAGDDDLQFAFPYASTVYIPANSFDVPPPSLELPKQTRMGPAQSFFDAPRMKEFNPNLIGVGECVTSFRQMLKRYGPFKSVLPPITRAEPDRKINVLFPYKSGFNTNEGLTLSNVLTGTLYDWIGRLYIFQVGSVRLLFSTEYPERTTYVRLDNTDIYDIASSNYFQERNYMGNISGVGEVGFWSMESELEIEVPFYQTVPANLTNIGAWPTTPEEGDINISPVNNGTSVIVDNVVPLNVYRAIGEDFAFGYSIGPPVVIRTFPG